ncbi:envelope glycoprotein [Marasmius tenuissimus]|uniref:Envelope glycoprotein n=1 Tax=Marasmius tenuissimus TaxID=585030 RepID=A0ABR3A6A2_9AGAR
MSSAFLVQTRSFYGYRPTFYVCVLYIALFSITLGIHLRQMISSRYWFLGPTVLFGALLELIGWIGRLWSNQNLSLRTPFVIQICCLIMGPTPLLAANFVIFGRLVSLLGTNYSRLRPNHYTYIFLGCVSLDILPALRIDSEIHAIFRIAKDILSLLLQGAGGGIAAVAEPGEPALKFGTNLMITGIALQVAMMTTFSILVGEYILRYIHDKPLKGRSSASGGEHFPLDARRNVLLYAMGSSTFLLLIRSVTFDSGIYRLIELGGGWNSTIMHTEWLFNVFDAAVVFVAFVIWNVAHPSILMEDGRISALALGKMTPRGLNSKSMIPE